MSFSHETTIQFAESATGQWTDTRSEQQESKGSATDMLLTSILISLRVEMQSMSTLMDVLTTVSRVGATIDSVTAADNALSIAVIAREPVGRRLPALIQQLIGVIAVAEDSRSAIETSERAR